MAKLTYTDLLKLGQTLGYPLNKEGLCQGFSGMLSQAWLVNDTKTFFKRLNFIETYNNDFERLKTDIDKAREHAKNNRYADLDETTMLLLEIPAFYDGVELYLMPHQHKDLLANDAITQENIDTIYSLVRPKQLEQDNVSIVLNKPYAFDRRSLINYLEDLKKTLGSQGSTAPIFLRSGEHTVSLRYSEQKKTWQYVDTNDFGRYPDEKSYSRELNSYLLAESIFESFGCGNHAVFSTVVITKSNNQNDLKIKLDEFDKQYPITSQQANMYDNNQTGVLYLACREGRLDDVRELLKYTDIDVNHKKAEGFTPLFLACQNGHLDVVRELLKHKDIQVNAVVNDGATPLFLACQNGHLDVVRELLKHKDIQSYCQIWCMHKIVSCISV
jgi:hypothetical protein